ncbi:hypothetical protein [uncultured Thiodictyon sp.]|uniref:TubC N-terminal docking domain-related protein n=1 Tax=uncultured Thiodictyon sp. TaxID=1846217 RepID=UPI0025F5A2B5|nr:hypothetical protein [uncultured Thiodictyon sp.]
MLATQLLDHLTAAGVRLELQGDKLRAGPAAALTPGLRGLIAENKPALVAMLSRPASSLEPDPLSQDDEAAVLRWLASIGETDPGEIAATIARCRSSAAAREYFVGRAAEVPGIGQDTAAAPAPRCRSWLVTYADGSTEHLTFVAPACLADVRHRRPVSESIAPAGEVTA